MLNTRRHPGEAVRLTIPPGHPGGIIVIRVDRTGTDFTTLGIAAPADVPIHLEGPARHRGPLRRRKGA
jgi:hypothetical protein